MLTYAGLCITIFKVFRLPLNKWTVPTAVLGGGVLISAIMFTMNYNHPYSESAREYFVTTPIVPNVSGTVIAVHVEPNEPVPTGTPLFTLDPTPFQTVVDSLSAREVSAEHDYQRIKTMYERKAVSLREYDQALATYQDISAQLRKAQFDLASTVIKAPTDGYVTHNFLRPGMRAVAAPLRPLMVFVHKEDAYFTAMFRQNALLRLQKGNLAEISLDSLPGEVFEAEVAMVVPAMREGQLQASGDMIGFNPLAQPGRVAVVLRVTDPDFEKYRQEVPLGSFAQAAVYSEHAEHFAIIRKILLRMSSWIHYIYPLH